MAVLGCLWKRFFSFHSFPIKFEGLKGFEFRCLGCRDLGDWGLGHRANIVGALAETDSRTWCQHPAKHK